MTRILNRNQWRGSRQHDLRRAAVRRAALRVARDMLRTVATLPPTTEHHIATPTTADLRTLLKVQ